MGTFHDSFCSPYLQTSYWLINSLYSEEYLRYVLYTSLANNTKIYFGDKIPTIFTDWGVQIPLAGANTGPSADKKTQN